MNLLDVTKSPQVICAGTFGFFRCAVFLRFALHSSDNQILPPVSIFQAVFIYVRKLQLADDGGSAVCGSSLAETVGSNPTEGMDVCMLCVLCVVR